jgi:hypothetical protein
LSWDKGGTTTNQSWSSVVGSTYVFTASDLALASTTNTFTITVTAPDKSTTKSYAIAVPCGGASITISTPDPSYSGLGFPSSSSIAQGQIYSLAPSNASLLAIASGWTWRVDGVLKASVTGPSFSLSASDTSAMLGTYTISASVLGTDGVTYTGRSSLTVNVSTAMNLTDTALPSSPLAGTGSAGFLDGVASVAMFNDPDAIATDGTNLYIADYANRRIRKIVISSGVVSTIAGSGTSGSADNSNGLSATFSGVDGMVVSGGYLYVSDMGSHKIRKISLSDYAVTTLAGYGSAGSADSTDSTGTSAYFNNPAGLATDGSYLYLADQSNNEIRKIDIATGAVTTLAGSTTSGAADGAGTSASFHTPWGIACDGTYLYVGDYSNHAIRRITISSSAVTTLYTGSSSFHPWGVAIYGNSLFVADGGSSNGYIEKIDVATGTMTQVMSIASSTNSAQGLAIYGSTLYFVHGGLNAVYAIK